MNEYKRPSTNFHRYAKFEILSNMQEYLENFQELLGFTIRDLQVQQEEEDSRSHDQQTSLGGQLSPAPPMTANGSEGSSRSLDRQIRALSSLQKDSERDFDMLLDIPSMKNLKRLISQRKYLHEKGDLAQRIKGFMLDLDFYFR